MSAKLIVVQGAPAAGKTTVSKRLVAQLEHVLLLSKDEIKEFLFDTQPAGDRDWSRVLGKASIASMYAIAKVLLDSGRDVMIEGALYPEYARQEVAALGVEVIEVYCRCDTDVLIRRFSDRAIVNRHPGHMDTLATYDQSMIEKYQPLHLGATITINTTYGIDETTYADVVHQLKQFLEG